ncbi:hypothetical protein MMC18_008851 [Xylographa bjoerkii]|nr:hypothetical protein [Xylographa bjoerkii]MCJ1395965.1 hypothetical protein [Xylographa bjoerkii]
MSMFEVPNAKRVRREDLYSASISPRSSSPDEDTKAILKQKYESLYQPAAKETGFLPVVEREVFHTDALDHAEPKEDDGFEFRLFSKPATGLSSGTEVPTQASRIVLRSPSPINVEPGFVQPRRPDSYYFATETTTEEASHYQSAAFSGEAVRAEQLRRWPGCELLWKVMTIKLSSTGLSKLPTVTPKVTAGKKRAGKKRRIILRKRLMLEKAKQTALSMSKSEKEVAEREKRTRRNREKKVKKKEKDKLKKATSA